MKPLLKTLGILSAISFIVMSHISLSLAEMSKWNLDFDHSTIGFQVKHMVVSKTNGKFLKYTGVKPNNLKPFKLPLTRTRCSLIMRSVMPTFEVWTSLMPTPFQL